MSGEFQCCMERRPLYGVCFEQSAAEVRYAAEERKASLLVSS
jgi:hypothetical protein